MIYLDRKCKDDEICNGEMDVSINNLKLCVRGMNCENEINVKILREGRKVKKENFIMNVVLEMWLVGVKCIFEVLDWKFFCFVGNFICERKRVEMIIRKFFY